MRQPDARRAAKVAKQQAELEAARAAQASLRMSEVIQREKAAEHISLARINTIDAFESEAAAKLASRHPRFKVVLTGESGVGKSSLILSFTERTFHEKHSITLGVDFKVKTVDLGEPQQTVELQIWDTAGQDQYRTVTHSYYRGAKGCLIVYDITRRVTFDALTKWLSDVRARADPNIQMLLVGNKSDVPAEQRAVSPAEGQRFATEHGLLFLETSAKTARNVEVAFMNTTRRMYEHSPPY